MKVGDQIYTPEGRGVVLEIDGTDVKVARIKPDGSKVELYYEASVLHKVPTDTDLEIQASFTFRHAHPEFNPCAANVQLMKDYVQGHLWAWTAENLERAYTALKSKLAPMPAPAPVAPAPVAPVTPVVVTPTAPPITPAAPQLTKREIASWSREVMREKMQDPEVVKQMEALGIRVLKTLDANRGQTRK